VSEQQAVTFHQCLALAGRERFAELIGIRSPHALEIRRAGLRKALQELRLESEVVLQLLPHRRNAGIVGAHGSDLATQTQRGKTGVAGR
jgi:hypothetical protein